MGVKDYFLGIYTLTDKGRLTFEVAVEAWQEVTRSLPGAPVAGIAEAYMTT